MGYRRCAYRFLLGIMTERDHLEKLGVDGKYNIKGDLKDVGRGH
jgi:hypothetical protein